MDDSKIVGLFFERSQKGLSELSQKYGNLSLRIAENILKSREDAEECVNDAYTVIWNKIPPENPSPLSSYFLKIVRNIALKKYHLNTAKKRNSFYDAALEELENMLCSESSTEDEYTAKEISAAISRYLRTLEKNNRILFIRRYFYGDSIQSLGELYGKTPHYISVKLSRIREDLKKYLTKEGLI